jgi:hypothetical protein
MAHIIVTINSETHYVLPEFTGKFKELLGELKERRLPIVVEYGIAGAFKEYEDYTDFVIQWKSRYKKLFNIDELWIYSHRIKRKTGLEHLTVSLRPITQEEADKLR